MGRNLKAETPLATIRVHAGISQDELATRLGVTRHHVSMVERGHRPLPRRSAGRWARAVGVAADELRAAASVRAAVVDEDAETLRGLIDPDVEPDYEAIVAVIRRMVDAGRADPNEKEKK
jgi:transcriptional regulator with XRE-family HTH domain